MYALQAIGIPVVLLFTVLHFRSPLGVVLEARPLAWLGRISYSVYLWQQLFLVWNGAGTTLLFPLQRWPVNIATVLVVAAASYYLIEKSCIRLGSRLAVMLEAPSSERTNDTGGEEFANAAVEAKS
jgi:peptidoglycan/LPS O-acetylase OafA/YrhL